MTSRIVKIGRQQQVITTRWIAGTGTHADVHEHVTLETPKPITDTQRMRLLSTWEQAREWQS